MYIQLDQVINCDIELELLLRDCECEHLSEHYTAILTDEYEVIHASEISFFEKLSVPIVAVVDQLVEGNAIVFRDTQNRIWITEEEYEQLFT